MDRDKFEEVFALGCGVAPLAIWVLLVIVLIIAGVK